MDPGDVTQFSKAIQSLAKEGPGGKVIFEEIELSLEECNDSCGPLGELVDTLKLTSPVIVAWKYNPNSRKPSSSTAHASDSIMNSTEISAESKNDNEGNEFGTSVLEGSPLKLVTFADLSAIGHVGTVQKSCLPVTRLRKYDPLSARRAQFLLSLYVSVQQKQGSKGNYLQPLWVLCDGKKPGQVVCMSVGHTALPDTNCNVNLACTQRSTLVTMSGPHPKRFYTRNPLKSKSRLTSCQAEYDVIGSLSKENPMAELQGSVKLEVKWSSGQHLLENPPVDAQVTAKVQVARGDTRSAGYVLYSELDLLRRLVESLTSGEICWPASDRTCPLLEELKTLLGNLALGDAKPPRPGSESEAVCDTTVIQSVRESLELEERNDQDFTDYIWIVLKKCASFSELVECLQLIFSQVKSGKLQPMVHRNNKTSMAQLMRDSYTGRVYFPCIATGTLAIELLAEMGMEKLTKDYIHAFLSKDLTTPKYLEYFSVRDILLADKLERLEKLHCVLELMIIMKTFLSTPQATLSTCAWQALQFFEKNKLDWEKVFNVPIPTQSVTKLLESAQPCKWQCDETKSGGTSKDALIRRLSTEMPFQHLEHNKLSSALDNSQLDSTYALVELDYFLVKIDDSVILL